MVDWRGDSRESDGVERIVVKPPEVSRSKLKNIKSKNFKILVVSRPGADGDADIRYGGGKSKKNARNIDG
jgi:hypothetical protein